MEPTLQVEYDSIQKQQLVIRKTIEIKIRKLKMGAIPWSSKLQGFRDAIELWSMVWRKRKGVRVSTTKIRRYMLKTGIWHALQCDRDNAGDMLREAHSEYRVAKKNAVVWRDSFLDSLAEAKAKKNGTSVELETTKLKRVDKQKTQARNVKRMLKN